MLENCLGLPECTDTPALDDMSDVKRPFMLTALLNSFLKLIFKLGMRDLRLHSPLGGSVVGLLHCKDKIDSCLAFPLKAFASAKLHEPNVFGEVSESYPFIKGMAEAPFPN